MVDLYHKIYDGEIFKTSNCIWHENAVMEFFRSQLTSLGYKSVSDSNKVWQRGNQKVVVCLVDDFSTCSNEYEIALPYKFDKNTVVITDNFVTVPTQYTVFQLPSSFFGIYNHTPANLQWQPDRRFNFSVNRLDQKRMLVLLEIWNRCMMMSDEFGSTLTKKHDYINFNCWAWEGDNSSQQGLKENFTNQWNQLEENYQQVFAHAYQSLLPDMPWINHELSHEQSHVSAWLNVVMETYSSDTTVALSEKVFRAMCLPVPWILYAGKNTVSYLHSLGFDVLHDIVKHKYDDMIENKTATYGDKLVDFVWCGADTVEQIKPQDFKKTTQRCSEAADHNRKLLQKMAQQWPHDLVAWLPAVIDRIA